MREIKFRAWDKERKVFAKSLEMLRPSIPAVSTKRGFKLHSKFILTQYTGLKDKNGKEIYEGDILRKNGTIEFNVYPSDHEDGWGETVWYSGFRFISHSEKDKVIGNVYENPELLEEK